MNKDGLDIGSIGNGASPEHLKATLKYKTDSQKLNNEFWQNFTENLLSAHFLVFLVTCLVIVSGFVFMYRASSLADVIDYWKLILPVVTTYIGYAIGKYKPK
jgi:uncharacterized membrane protein